jgi:hypothetical protein
MPFSPLWPLALAPVSLDLHLMSMQLAVNFGTQEMVYWPLS